MESPNEISDNEMTELTSLTTKLESFASNFSLSGENVSGDVESGFVINREEEE